MPRVISDELYDQLMGCIKQQRLLGVMGMLERMQETAIEVRPMPIVTIWDNKLKDYVALSAKYEVVDAESTTNYN